MSDQDSAREREFEALVPWCVNGTLDAAGSDRISVLRQELPDGEATIEADRRLQRRLRAAAVPVPEGTFDLVRQRIGLIAPRPSWRERLARWLGTPALGPIGALAALLVVVQGVTIGMLVQRHAAPTEAPEYGQTRSLESSQGPDRAYRIEFLPDARESDIRYLLVEVGARIIDGPSQLGDYIVELPASSGEDALGKLKASGIVQSVGKARGRPREE